MTDNELAPEHRLAALQRAQDEVLRLEGECARLRKDAERLRSAMSEVLEFQSAKSTPSIHDWGRYGEGLAI